MTTFALVLGALLAIACVVFVSRPFLREPAVATDGGHDEPEVEIDALQPPPKDVFSPPTDPTGAS